MAGAGGAEIGRISVRVVPDLDGFHTAVKAAVKAAEKQKADIELSVDAAKFRTKVAAATKGLPDAVVKVKADIDRFVRRTSSELGSAMSRLEQKIPLTIDGEKFRRDVNGAEKRLKKLLRERPDGDLAATTDWRREVQEQLDALVELDKQTKKPFKIQLETDPNFDYRLRQRLAKLPDKHEIKLELDPTADFRLRQRIQAIKPKVEVDVEVKRGVFSRLSEAISSVRSPGFGTGINPSGYVAIFAAIAVVAAPLLGLITTTLLAIPGVISAIAAPIAAITVGLDGFKKAAKTLEEPFKNLKTHMDSVNESEFSPVFERLTPLIDTLKGSLPKVSAGLADLMGGVVDSLTSEEGLAKTERSLINIGNALSDAAPGMRDFVDGLLSLGEEFTKQLPGLTDWFNETGEDFRNWVDRIISNGELDQAFEGLGETLKVILDTLGELALEGFEFIKNPENMDDFLEGLASIKDALVSIAELSNTLSNLTDNLFGGLLPEVSPEGFWADITAPIRSEDAPWRDMFPSISDMFPPDQEIRAEADRVRNTLRESLANETDIEYSGGGGAFNATEIGDNIKKQFSHEFQQVLDEADRQISELGPKLQSAIDTAMRPLEGIPAIVQGTFNDLAVEVGAAWSVVITTVSTGAEQVRTAIASAWAALPVVVASSFSPVSATVETEMSKVVTTVVTKGGEVVTELQSWPEKFKGALGKLDTTLESAGIALVQGLINGINEKKGEAVEAARQMASEVAAAAEGELGIKSPSRVFHGIGENVGLGFSDGIHDQTGNAVGSIQTLLDEVKAVFGDTSLLSMDLDTGPLESMESSMSSMAESASIFEKSMKEALTPSQQLTAEGQKQLDFIKQKLAELEIERLKLKDQKNNATSKDEKKRIQGMIDQIQHQKDALRLHKSELEYAKKYNGSVTDTADQYQQMLQSMHDMPWNFARSNQQQLFSDLGIGGGALTNGLEAGLDWAQGAASNFIFNVSNTDEAIAIKNNQINKQSLQYNGR